MSIPSIRILPLEGSVYESLAYRPSTALRKTYESQERHRQSTLARAGPPQKTNALAAAQVEGDVLDDRRQLRRVADPQVLDGYQGFAVGRWPVRRRAVVLNDGGRFLGKIQVFDNTFDGALARSVMFL